MIYLASFTLAYIGMGILFASVCRVSNKDGSKLTSLDAIKSTAFILFCWPYIAIKMKPDNND